MSEIYDLDALEVVLRLRPPLLRKARLYVEDFDRLNGILAKSDALLCDPCIYTPLDEVEIGRICGSLSLYAVKKSANEKRYVWRSDEYLYLLRPFSGRIDTSADRLRIATKILERMGYLPPSRQDLSYCEEMELIDEHFFPTAATFPSKFRRIAPPPFVRFECDRGFKEAVKAMLLGENFDSYFAAQYFFSPCPRAGIFRDISRAIEFLDLATREETSSSSGEDDSGRGIFPPFPDGL